MTIEINNVTEPLVSVIMPAFNSAQYIDEAIQSVLCQTCSNLELIVVDDCSTDNTVEIVAHYCSEDTRVRLLQCPKNAGVANARNAGVAIANGEWIALLDSDDIWMEDKLEKQLSLAQKTNADLIYCSYLLMDEEHEKPFVVPEEADYQLMLFKSVISCSTVLMSWKVAQKFRFDNRYYHEDYVFWLSILKDGYQARGCKELLAKYRLRQGARSFNKLTSALRRWDIYRNYLHMSLYRSCITFAHYAIEGVRKYI